ncbi:DNA helicase RecQ [Limibacter armeniacum]|uniref:DNA helicase RecQ n=1 Tax=Limibacter armeniacum TaxID=466084 RepID=UPI002FE5FCF9
MVRTEIDDSLRLKLKEVFGYNQFRGEQENIIRNILAGRNTFVIMPTGAGKSLCYQLPALVKDGTAIVISPLIALMKNQVDQLNAVGINAQFLNSTLSKSEANKVKKQLLAGEVKLLYVAPESLTKEENIDLLQSCHLSFAAIDEAHCISEWGHDFRPEYRRIRSIVEQLGDGLPIIALTATATPKVRADIQKNLSMEDADVFLSSFFRENLYYEVRPKVNPQKQLIKFIKQHKGQSGIIYCLSRKKVEEIAEFLRVNDVKALPYHAGMDASIRMNNQDGFLNEDVDVIVATIAFGMGIDKPDVRFVIHYDVPKSLEGYYQETGRAGRDGIESQCLMFFSPKDIQKLEKFNKDKPVTERDNARLLLQEMSYYSNSSVCRPRQLLHYFGENMGKNCGHCDNCRRKHEEFEGKDAVLLSLKAILQTGQRFGIEHIINVIMGIDDQYVNSYNHNSLEVYGKGSNEDKAYWETVIRQAMILNFIQKDTDNIKILKVTDEGLDYMDSPSAVMLTKDHDYSNEQVEENDTEEPAAALSFDEALYELIKGLRKKIAKQKNLPPYVIFQEPSMEEMATLYPTTIQDLAQINGVGMGKARKFGQAFAELIKKYVEENEIETASDVVVKSAVDKSKIKIYIIQQIDRKMDLEDIADNKRMSFDDLLSEIEHICYSGTKLNLDYYIEQIMDDEKIDEIYDYFMEAETDSLSKALDELDEDISEDEIRLMRIKFLSELAM